MNNTIWKLFTELTSRKWVSRTTGAFAKSRLSRPLISSFAKAYGISISEAEKAIHEYGSLNEFFTRRLKPGSRTIDSAPEALVSSVDAVITGMGPVNEGTVFQVKGQDYTVEELLNVSPRHVTYKNGYCLVLYLSPTDYHRIHAPVSGQVVETEHVPGKVYPVNEFGLRHMKRVLSRNERLVTFIRHESGEIAVVKVGALNVSSIRYVNGTAPASVTRGDELAYFEFGSTVVLLTESGTFVPDPALHVGSKVRMGQRLGTLVPAGEEN